ncbi:MAG: hypothetical protein HYY90_04375 [Candidatus Omnitrophica bacterium]|nr:hypothetical protein [Candidatus Omnitrophota bacterium]MBI3083580.1 hypothetical protein [Candidatus Omnitrophota bacterium]
MWVGLLSVVWCLWSAGCGYTTRPGLASHLKTIYVKPFANKIDITEFTSGQGQFPIYRHRMEVDLTNAVLARFQFTGLLRPDTAERATTRLEGELLNFRRDALRYNAAEQVEEWRLSVVVSVRFIDQTANTVLWEEEGLTGDTTYFALGSNTETEAAALDRALTDLARRIVERTVENW